MFSLDVCHVLQFYREVLAEPISHNNSLIILDHPWSSLIILDHPWSSLIILDHPWSSCIFWNHLESWHIFGNFWILLDLLGYIGDLLEIHHQGLISYHQLYSANMHNFNISISYKSSFFYEHSMSKRCTKGTHALPLGIRLCQDFTFEAIAIKGHPCGHACLWFIPVLAEAPLGGWISISWTAGLAFLSIEYNILQYYIESVALYCEGPIVYANLIGQPQTCTRSKDKEMLHRTPLSTFHPASIPPKSMVSLPSFLEYIQRHA